jgi:hypothetical protein
MTANTRGVDMNMVVMKMNFDLDPFYLNQRRVADLVGAAEALASAVRGVRTGAGEKSQALATAASYKSRLLRRIRHVQSAPPTFELAFSGDLHVGSLAYSLCGLAPSRRFPGGAPNTL